jgi:hypothetical protein
VGPILRRDWQYLLGQVLYNTGPDRSPLSWWLGAGFLGLLARRSWRDRIYLGIAVTCVLCVAFWALNSADPRYIVPAVGLLALLAGLVADRVITAVSRFARFTADLRLAPLWAGAALVCTLWSSFGFITWFDVSAHGLPLSAKDVNQYLAYNIPCYAAVRYLNSNAGEHYRAWGYSCEQSRYYANSLLIGDAFSVGARDRIFNDLGAELPSDRTLWLRLRPLRVGWVILNNQPRAAIARLQQHGLFRYVTTQSPEQIFRVAPTG